MPESGSSRIAILGDLHGSWTPFDAVFFNASDYDALVFVGDLAGGTPAHDRQIARSIARVGKPCWFLLGNNDVQALPLIEAEFDLQEGLSDLLAGSRASTTRLCGYSSHVLRAGAGSVTMIAARPCAMGGSELSFAEVLAQRHGITSLQQSTERLCGLVDAAEGEDLMFLAHNGPHGLGAEPYDMWGNDFSESGGDWGDADLAEAVNYAVQQGKRVHAVIAGHMHRRVRGGGTRPFRRTLRGIQYVNPAQVPRVVPSGQGALHHHVSLNWRDGEARFEEHWVNDGEV